MRESIFWHLRENIESRTADTIKATATASALNNEELISDMADIIKTHKQMIRAAAMVDSYCVNGPILYHGPKKVDSDF